MDFGELFGEDPDWIAKDGDEEGKGEEEEDEDTFGSGSQHTLVLVDCRPEMMAEFLPDPQLDELLSPVHVALSACEQIIRDKVRIATTMKTGKRDGFGVCLFNTRNRARIGDTAAASDDETKKKGAAKMEQDSDDESTGYVTPDTTVHEILALAPPGVKSVLKIKACTDMWSDFDVVDEFKHETDDAELPDASAATDATSPLQVALYEASQIFSLAPCVKSAGGKIADDTKQLWIFTNDDDPAGGNSAVYKVLETAAKDLQHNNVQVTVLPLPVQTKAAFQYAKFYDPIGAKTPARDLKTEQLDDVLKNLAGQWKKTRRAFGIPLLWPDWKENTDRPSVMLDFYRMVQFSTRPSTVMIHQETGRELVKVVQKVTGNNEQIAVKVMGTANKSKSIAAALGPTSSGNIDRMRSFVEFGGERVSMSALDKVDIKKAGNANNEFASLILLGFKPKDAVPFTHSTEAAYFVYPNDEKVEGSCSAFAHLHASMLRKGVVAMGELLTRTNTSSRIVAMSPVPETVFREEVDGQIIEHLVKPPGMKIVTVPFEDEVRSLGEDEATLSLASGGMGVATDSIVDAACALIENYPPLADDVEIGKNFTNVALTKYWDYVTRVALNEPTPSYGDFDTVVDKESVLKQAGEHIAALNDLLPPDLEKEKAAGKKRALVPDDSNVDWEMLYLQGTVSSCTSDKLKAKLRSIEGAMLGGKKADLVLRVQGYLETEFGATDTKAVKME